MIGEKVIILNLALQYWQIVNCEHFHYFVIKIIYESIFMARSDTYSFNAWLDTFNERLSNFLNLIEDDK